MSVVVSACSVNVSQTSGSPVEKNLCSANSDCGDGECWNGICVAHQGALSNVLLSVTPPVGSPVAGIDGLRFLTVAMDLSRSNEQHDIDLAGASTVRGYILSSCPFQVTLTPASGYGLPAVSYVTHTSSVDIPAPACRDQLTLAGTAQEFFVNVPPGTFDVYISPTSSVAGADGGASSCGVAPEVFPGLVKAQAGVSCVSIKQVAPKTLDVRIPWPSAAPWLQGWTLDVLHPITGQILSQPSEPLHGAPTAADGAFYYRRSVTYSPIASGGPSVVGQELLRLSPPTPDAGPVLQFSIAGAIASSAPTASGPQKAVLPDGIGPIPTKVRVEAWVYQADDAAKGTDTPVAGSVTFNATRVDMPSAGIFASFSASADIESDGSFATDLFPGDYLVRVVPAVAQRNGAVLASQEWTFTVRQSNGASGTVQAGRQFLVNDAATLTGRAVSASGASIAAASVQALPAVAGTRRCPDMDAGDCAAASVGVLEMSLGESAYVPRVATAVSRGDGRFTLSGVDCGDCSDGRDAGSGERSSAIFDVVVQPADGTHVPWLVWPHVDVSGGAADLGLQYATLPIIQRGRVQVPNGMSGAPPSVPGTLIRAYVVRDASGAPIADPTGLPSCSSGTYIGPTESTRCIRSALQVAETRADSQGNYELVLPASVDATPE
ncbi:MAG TPA: hypothetical protein VHC69_31555 [Polyangiaceae bacterium]|nr:hypothetical protein [Polyangiaceae bacterium]